MMKKWIMVAVMALSMVATAQQAMAEEASDFQPYIGIGISSLKFDATSLNGGGFTGFNSPSVTGFVIKGGVDIYRYFGMEIRSFFTGTGTSSGTYLAVPVSFSIKVNNAFAYYAKLQAPLAGGVRVYALGGGSQASLTASATVAGKLISTSGSNGSSGSYGGGIAYDAATGLSVELEWMRYASDVSAASLFASYRF